MKKRILIICIIIAVLLGFAVITPYPEKIEKTYYGTETYSGEKATISVDMTYMQYLLRRDKIYGEVTVVCGDKTICYQKDFFQYIGFWPLDEDPEAIHYFIGWYWDTDMIRAGRIDSIRAYISKDLSRIMIYHHADENQEDSSPKQYIGNIEEGRNEETKEYFGPYAK